MLGRERLVPSSEATKEAWGIDIITSYVRHQKLRDEGGIPFVAEEHRLDSTGTLRHGRATEFAQRLEHGVIVNKLN